LGRKEVCPKPTGEANKRAESSVREVKQAKLGDTTLELRTKRKDQGKVGTIGKDQCREEKG